ncbi:MAG: zinc ribbon domain-containing protein [Spirochaetia bacterium]|nr:zinc ribbon domain-containing protein [Spirochaetia bacterium]
MAVYEFQCTKCKKQFTVEQSMKDPLPTDCPYCKAKNSLHQKYEPAPVFFHGSGFYCTDCKKASGSSK